MPRSAYNMIFILAGALALAIAVIMKLVSGTQFWPSLADILINVGVSLLVVSVIEVAWRNKIGDPILDSVKEIRASIVILRELWDTGIIRLHQKRDDFRERNRMTPLLQRIQTAHTVNMVGRVLYRSWAVNDEFTKIMRQGARTNQCTFRILVLDPEGPAAQRRDKQEVHTGVQEGLMLLNIRSSIGKFTELINELPPDARDRIQLRKLWDVEPHAQIVIVDDYAWIQLYLYHARGGASPSIEVEGSQSTMYQLYANEFDRLWEDALPVTPDSAPVSPA